MNPSGRRESLEALYEAQSLQAELRHLSVWAQGLRAEMEAQSTPSSPAEARCRLEEHQELKVRAGPWDLILPLPCHNFL